MNKGRLPTTLCATVALLATTPVLAQEATGQPGEAPTATPATQGRTSAPSDDAATSNNDIIVTATRRPERLRDVAGGVSALTGEQLEAIGAQDFRDYLNRTPGVAFNDGPPQNSAVVIRGVGTTAGLDQGQGTTGYFINDVPLTEPGYAVVIPDIDAFDVNRVEVLRGPQGSLFGSASLGGAVNYISNLADPGKIDAAAEGGVTSTRNAGGELGYRAKAMVNLPIVTDKLAARLTVTKRVDAGYIDNVGTGEEGANDVHNLGVRGSIVFTPDAGTKLTYLGLYYRTRADDNSFAQLQFGELARSSAFPQTERYDTQIHSLRLDHDFGGYDFVGIAAYNRKTGDLRFDYAPFTGFVVPGAEHRFRQDGNSNVYSLDIRLASPRNETFDWLIGATAIDTEKRFEEHLSATGAAAVLPPAAIVTGDEYYFGAGDTRALEIAMFGEANLHLGPVTVTGGGRLFNNEQTRRSEARGFFFPTPSFTPNVEVTDSGFAPKASVKYTISRDAMVYALASKGFRFGSPNLGLIPLAGFTTPAATASDSLWNYEVGARLSFAERRILLDVTGFWIDWKDLQVRLTRPDDFTYGANAGQAEIKGIEATLSANLGGFSYSFNGTYLDARLSEALATPGGGVPVGKRLPSSAKWRLSNTASYDFGGIARPTLTFLHRYVSEANGYLTTNEVFDGYNIFDARASIDVGNFKIAGFVNNIGDKRAVTFGYGSSAFGQTQFYVRPRTYGLQINWALR